MDITQLLAFSVKNKASDLHLSAGLPPMIRVHGDVRRINVEALDHKMVHDMVYDIMNDAQRKAYVLADNKLALNAGWDAEMLRCELQGLGDLGFDLALTRAVSDAVSVPVIASGGVGTLQHLADGDSEGHASAVLAASIFHFGQHTVQEAKTYMKERGIPVRI